MQNLHLDIRKLLISEIELPPIKNKNIPTLNNKMLEFK
jgi:hypothetical protein